jgi:RNA polymerase sigma-70 factor (ECF subfamily)
VEIDAWYRRYGESVHRRCLRLCRDPQQALDLAQEVFLRAHRYRSSYRGEASPLTWLFTLTDNCFFDLRAKSRPIAAAEVAEFLASERDGFEREFVSHDLVVRLLERSSADVRAIVLHRYFDELDLETIAQRLGQSERTVRRKLARFLELAARLAGERP